MGRFDLEIDNSGDPPFCCLDTSSAVLDLGLACYTPTTSLDYCDAAAERLVLQDDGAIGAIAYVRLAMADPVAGGNFAYFYRSIFENSAYSLGEILLSTRMYLFPDKELTAQYGMTLFGDPALNIVWENVGDSGVDSTDIVVKNTNIEFTNAVKNRYIGTSESVELSVFVTNSWHDDAYQVPIEVWDGDPRESGSTLLAVDTIAAIPAYGGVDAIVNLGRVAEGEHKIYVDADITT